MNRTETDAEALRVREEDYYRDLWSRESWGAAAPNPDEAARATKIVGLIEEHVLPATGGKASRILDLGCGRGWLTNVLSRFGEVVGIDPTGAGIERACELFPGLDFRHTDSAELRRTDGDGRFGLVVSSEVIEHVERPHRAQFLCDIRALLAPGGFAILTTPRGELQRSWEQCQPEEQPVEEWLREDELRALAVEAGFIVRTAERVFVPVSLADPLSDFVQSRWYAALARRLPRSRFLAWLRRRCAIYQVALLQRPAEQL